VSPVSCLKTQDATADVYTGKLGVIITRRNTPKQLNTFPFNASASRKILSSTYIYTHT
jgi:hypothetical protein